MFKKKILNVDYDVFNGEAWRRMKVKGSQTNRMLLALIRGKVVSSDMPRGFRTSAYIYGLKNINGLCITSTESRHRVNSQKWGRHSIYELMTPVKIYNIEYDKWWRWW